MIQKKKEILFLKYMATLKICKLTKRLKIIITNICYTYLKINNNFRKCGNLKSSVGIKRTFSKSQKLQIKTFSPAFARFLISVLDFCTSKLKHYTHLSTKHMPHFTQMHAHTHTYFALFRSSRSKCPNDQCKSA